MNVKDASRGKPAETRETGHGNGADNMAEISREDIQEIKADLKELVKKVAAMEALAATESDRCPFRVEISKATNNVARLEKVEMRVEATADKLAQRIEAEAKELAAKVEINSNSIQLLKLNWAKLLGLMVGAGAAGGIISEGLAKLIS